MWRIIAILIAGFFIMSSVTFLNAQTETPVASEEAKRAYADALMFHLKNNWDYKTSPEKFKDTVVVNLKIDREGNVLEKVITKPALDNGLNEQALQQLAEMEPFPQMPASFNEDAGSVEFQYQFKPTAISVDLEDASKYVK